MTEGDPVTPAHGLVLQTNASSAAFLEVLALHLAQQFPSTLGDRCIVVEGSHGARRGNGDGSGAILDAVIERLQAQGAVDRVIDARNRGRHCAALLGLEAVRSKHVLVVEAPVLFHCSDPNWLEPAVEALQSDHKLCMVRLRRSQPGIRPKVTRSAAAGYFLCEKARVSAKFRCSDGAGFALASDRTETGHAPRSLEQCLERAAPGSSRVSLELEGSASWAVRALYTGAPFPAWAPEIVAAVARGDCPELQRERYDIRLDRARDRDAWRSLFTGTNESHGPRFQGGVPLGGSRHVSPTVSSPEQSFRPRSVQSAGRRDAPRAVLLTPYLTRNGNPLLGRARYAKDRNELIEPWWSDVDRLGLHACIFHDELSDGFIERYTTGRISFERSTLPPQVSCNDHRFRLFRDWLREHPEVEHAFCTDLFDVRVKKNPFELSSAAPCIYAGVQPSSIGRNLYVRTKLFRAYGREFPELSNKAVLNAGILGGPRELLLPCLDAIVADLDAATSRLPAGNHNMGVFNRVLYSLDRVWARGAPLHSRFRAHDHGADVCFVHK